MRQNLTGEVTQELFHHFSCAVLARRENSGQSRGKQNRQKNTDMRTPGFEKNICKEGRYKRVVQNLSCSTFLDIISKLGLVNEENFPKHKVAQT